MTITVEGILPDPMGNPLIKAEIRVTTEESDVSPIGSEAIQKTTKLGEYSFTLEDGIFFIEVCQDDEYTKEIYVQIPPELTGSITLPQLMGDYEWIPQ